MADGTSDTNDPVMEVAEPSMEDILASIRQLIADDAVVPAAPEAVVSDKPVLDGLSADISDGPLELVNRLDNDAVENSDTADELSADSIEAFLEDPLNGFSDDDLVAGDDALDIPVLDSELDAIVPDMAEIPEVQLVDNIEAVAQPEPNDLTELDIPSELDISSELDADLNSLISEEPVPDALAQDMSTDDVELEDFDLDSLLDDMTAEPAEEGLSETPRADLVSPETVAVVGASALGAVVATAPEPSVDALDDIDGLMNDLTADLGVDATELVSDDVETVDDMPLDELSLDELSLDDMLSDVSVDAPVADTPIVDDVIEADVLEDAGLDLDIEAPDGTAEDPDIELVKSLMAELSDTPSLDDETLMDNAVVEQIVPEQTAADTVDVDDISALEGDLDMDGLLDDIISDTDAVEIADTSAMEADAIDAILSAEIDEAAPEALAETLVEPEAADETRSALSAFADEIEASDAPDVDTPDLDTPDASGAAIMAAATGVAAVAAAPKLSALDNLLSGNGDDVSMERADDDTEAVAFDDIVSNMMSDTDAGEDVTSEEQELGAALEALLDDEPEDLDLGTEIDVPEASLTELSEIIETDAAVDLAEEIVETQTDNAQTEIADMARKTATDTILDEVTETAAASAFASLNHVVDEKNLVEERGDRIGDLVTEALKPMLKEWLDKNLKTIVERAVTKEVKRISTGK